MTMLNAVGDKQLRDDVGAEQLDFLAQFCEHLGADINTASYRTAPSIIIRGECELFSVSAPRFGIRATLKDRGIINLRRLRFLAGTVEGWSKRRPGLGPNQTAAEVLPHELTGRSVQECRQAIEELAVSPGRSIADSLLTLSPQITSEYAVLEVDLGAAYGEELGAAVPFLRQLRLGGGLCAQAACFMCTAIMHEFTRGVYGIAEITALGHPSEKLELNVGGMGPQGIVRYFNDDRVGLNCSHQITHWHWVRSFACPRSETQAAGSELADCGVRLFARVLRSYVEAGFPVVVPVDVRLLEENLPLCLQDDVTAVARQYDDGDSILARNGRQPVYQEEFSSRRRTKIANHAIVVVGVHKQEQDEFLINDSASFPFLKASARQLLQARVYDAVELQGNPATRFDLEYPSPYILPVTPRDVQLPLFNVAEYGAVGGSGEPTAEGLLFLFQRLAGHDGPHWALTGEAGGCVDPGEIFLIASSDQTLPQRCLGKATRPFPHAGSSVTAIQLLSIFIDRRRQPKWLWVQHLPADRRRGATELLIYWDATKPPRSCVTPAVAEALAEYLVVAVEHVAGEWHRCHWGPLDQRIESWPADRLPDASLHGAGDARPDNAGSVDSTNLTGLKCALITSFDAQGVVSSQAHWPPSIGPLHEPYVDLYALMQPDLLRLPHQAEAVEGQPIDGRIETAMQQMADTTNKCIPQWPSTICGWITGERKVAAMTTFLPTIAHPVRSDMARMAQDAICFLYSVALALRNAEHPIGTIELVAGSRIEGIWPAMYDHDSLRRPTDTFVANLFSDDEVLSNVLDNLRAVVGKLNLAAECPIRFALELEPGPLFVLRDWETLQRFANALDADDVLRHRVGFNLDIAHWRLASAQTSARLPAITPQRIETESSCVFRRITHSHLAGHHNCAHFGDIAPLRLNTPDDFLPWLAMLARRLGTQHSEHMPLPYSGVISLEMEAAHSVDAVMSGITDVLSLLGRATR